MSNIMTASIFHAVGRGFRSEAHDKAKIAAALFSDASGDHYEYVGWIDVPYVNDEQWAEHVFDATQGSWSPRLTHHRRPGSRSLSVGDLIVGRRELLMQVGQTGFGKPFGGRTCWQAQAAIGVLLAPVDFMTDTAELARVQKSVG